MGREKNGKTTGRDETAPVAQKTRKKAAAPADEGFLGIPARTLKSLASRVEKLGEFYSIEGAVRKTVGQFYEHDSSEKGREVLWHLVEKGLLRFDRTYDLFPLLEESPLVPAASTVVGILQTLPEYPPNDQIHYPSIGGIPRSLSHILNAQYARSTEPFLAAAPHLPPHSQRGLSLVRRLHGEEIPEEHSREILIELAMKHARNELLEAWCVPWVKDGTACKRVLDIGTVPELVGRFGRPEEWIRALLDAGLEAKGHWRVPAMREALLAATPTELAALIGANPIATDDERAFPAVLDEHTYAPGALLAALASLDPIEQHQHLYGGRRRLAFHVLGRFAANGEAIPPLLDTLLHFENVVDDVNVDRVVAALRGLPKNRAHTLLRSLLSGFEVHDPFRIFDKRSIVLLAAHFDEELWETWLKAAQNNNMTTGDNTVLGSIGARGAEGLARWLEKATDEFGKEPDYYDKLGMIRCALLQALARGAEEGIPIDARWDSLLTTALRDASVYVFVPEREDAHRAFLKELPKERLPAILLDAIRGAKQPEKPFEYVSFLEDPKAVDEAISLLCERSSDVTELHRMNAALVKFKSMAEDSFARHIHRATKRSFLEGLVERFQWAELDPRAIRVALEGSVRETERTTLERLVRSVSGPEVLYLLFVGKEAEGFVPRKHSLSRSGGEAPGLANAEIPRTRTKARMTHLFTLDLEDVPALAARLAPQGTRALAYFVEDAGSGEYDDLDARLVAIPGTACDALPRRGASGAPIAVCELGVPSSWFAGEGDGPQDGGEDGGDGTTLRRLVASAHGHVGGGPLWIQDAERGKDRWIMQVNPGLCDVNLGDAGSLYIYEDETVFQCL